MKFSYLLIFCLLMNSPYLFAQADSVKPTARSLSFNGFIEGYYCYDFNKPVDKNRPAFFYNHNRHNEPDINLALVKAAFSNNKIHANLSLGAGTYMTANYESQPAIFENIYEANAGIKVSKRNLWVDFGVFQSHIGFESAQSDQDWTLTRSIGAESTPYYETGAKITYTSVNSKWLISALLLNGWQRIKRPSGFTKLSTGFQVQYKPDAVTTFNYSNFLGYDTPDSNLFFRNFHDFYAIFKINNHLSLTSGFDIGSQKLSHNNTSPYIWYAPVIIAKFTINPKLSLAGRWEYFHDPKQIIVKTENNEPFNVNGFSANIDYTLLPKAVLRLEARTLNSRKEIFKDGNAYSNTNNFLTTSLCLNF